LYAHMNNKRKRKKNSSSLFPVESKEWGTQNGPAVFSNFSSSDYFCICWWNHSSLWNSWSAVPRVSENFASGSLGIIVSESIPWLSESAPWFLDLWILAMGEKGLHSDVWSFLRVKVQLSPKVLLLHSHQCTVTLVYGHRSLSERLGEKLTA
jgi:hypothetical protein